MRSGCGRAGLNKKKKQVGVSGEGAKANYIWSPRALPQKLEPLYAFGINGHRCRAELSASSAVIFWEHFHQTNVFQCDTNSVAAVPQPLRVHTARQEHATNLPLHIFKVGIFFGCFVFRHPPKFPGVRERVDVSGCCLENETTK